MNNSIIRKNVEIFPNLLLHNRIKLADITSEREALKLTDEDIFNSDDIFPRKYELETLRYWRKKRLLPFFEHGKHAHISIAQLMWLRFLSELKNIGASIATLEEAFKFFMDRGYKDEIARLNLVQLKKNLIEEIDSAPEYIENLETLKNVERILNDRSLKYSIQIDFNYFNLNIIDYVVNKTEVYFSLTSEKTRNIQTKEIEKKGVFGIIRNHENKDFLNTVLDNEPVAYYDFEKRTLKKPAILFPAKFFIEDIFGDCSVSENSFNIKILTKTERGIFSEIKERNVIEIEMTLLHDKEKKKTFEIIKSDGNVNMENIKKLKILMGTKDYIKGQAKLKNGKISSFNPDENVLENVEDWDVNLEG
jgi:hypothetical protein